MALLYTNRVTPKIFGNLRFWSVVGLIRTLKDLRTSSSVSFCCDRLLEWATTFLVGWNRTSMSILGKHGQVSLFRIQAILLRVLLLALVSPTGIHSDNCCFRWSHQGE